MTTHPTLTDEQCPACRLGDPLEIVYGPPSDEMVAAAAAGVIALGGGSATGPGDAAFRCRGAECDAEWGLIDWER